MTLGSVIVPNSAICLILLQVHSSSVFGKPDYDPRQFADRRQSGAGRQLAVPDPVDDLRPELVEKRLGGVLINAYPIPQLGHVLQYRPNRLLW